MISDGLALLSGGFVGFTLGLIGGGGSVLAVPLLLYVVGMTDPHKAIGTSALAVAVNAFANLAQHARRGTVKWPCATVFGLSGIIGAALGSSLGKLMDGQRLLTLFGLVMLIVAAAMLRPRAEGAGENVHLDRRNAPKLIAVGLTVGGLSGFFGIGGGFLIVPGLILGSGMAMLNAIGSSLLSVGLFGLTTSVNYALSGLVDWPIALEFIGGGIIGGYIGSRLAQRLAAQRATLNRLFATLVAGVGVYLLWRNT
ncbi:UPF0721 transmembrane protein [Elstera cyanobacteriorum]|uniref:Probable membrane transporter protein n=1 Tax=Elstera cyanobacteriorum TaxID=2022747 RepID=A0A255XM99_9PROT|nr:sulfite exporter TauE/SafE family protein [Elstera cyanobacteriorum]OYQ18097.1 hypothetical protein CHR90_14140 [Elstera cyanobacteriorum]GFZ83859.1 UPF0721 transmembrane protein [Elstera cyanobacteriorum]